MAAKSTHHGDILIWINKVLQSCETNEQRRTAQNLANNYLTLIYKKQRCDYDKVMESYHYLFHNKKY